MKRGEVKVASVGMGCAKLNETSPYESEKLPSLLIMRPTLEERSSEARTLIPVTSIMFDGNEVRELYDLLKDYYESR